MTSLKSSLQPGRRRTTQIIIVIALACALGYFVSRIFAAGTSTAFEPETGTITSPAASIVVTGASAGSAVKFGTATTPTPTPTPSGTVLVNTTFDNYPVSAPMNLADYKNAMGDPAMAAFNGNLVNTSIVAASGHGNVMRQTLIAGEYGSSKGIVTAPTLPATVDEASISYDIRFDSNFDWGWGGKIPGLGGAADGTSIGVASGCNTGNSGAWSGRAMWITPGSYGSVQGSNELIGYMYNIYKTDPCGDNIRTGKAFTAGAWHTVKQYYKLNTPGVADGIHRMWLDGTMIVNNTAYRYRDNPSVHINKIMWSVFRGGHTVDWAGSRTGTIDFDNFRITTP